MDDVYLLGHSFVRNNTARRSFDQTSKARGGLNELSQLFWNTEKQQKQGNSFETSASFWDFSLGTLLGD